MLLKNTEVSPEKIRNLFKKLFDEEIDIYYRIESFRSNFKKINKENFKDLKDYQDHRSVIVYLSLRFPERYFFYKQRLFKSFAEKINYSYKPIAGQIKNIGHYQYLCSILKQELSRDQELLKLHKNRITDDCYYDENLNILTQDFVYAVVKHLQTQETSKTKAVREITINSLDATEISVKETKVNFTPKKTNYIQNNIENKRIGDLGELWVLEYEKQKLKQANKHNLAQKVRHIAQEDGDGAGYDILSYDANGKEIFIEVKTTKSYANSVFYITKNELEKSRIEQESYFLYRVYKFDVETSDAELLIIKGDLSDLCITPETYKVDIKNFKW